VRPVALVLLCAVGGCSSSRQPAAPPDSQMDQAGRAGAHALTLDRPAEAIQQYRAALHRAEMRDDLPEIIDYSYNLAVAQLAANQPAEALKTVRVTRAELARRDAAGFPALDLLEATALYRTGSRAEAAQLARAIEQGGEQPVAGQASFLLGLIADEQDDAAALSAARRGLGQPATEAGRADALELSARIARRQGDAKDAERMAEEAASIRRDLRDYRGVARALAVAATAAQQSGAASAAAAYYLRAGRSAAVQGDTAAARTWLKQAVSLSSDRELRSEAQESLRELAQ
jgi:hypothetical protein